MMRVAMSQALKLLIRLAVLLLLVAISFYVLVPLMFWLSPKTMQHVFFLNFVKVPFVDYTDLSHHGVRSLGRNFYITSDKTNASSSSSESPRLGVWHILPASISQQLRDKGNGEGMNEQTKVEKMLDSGPQAVMLYLHGNSFDRTTKHRCELYNVLSEMDFHVLAVDYRGYGDSEGHPDEEGVVADAHTLYLYAKRMAPSKPIYVWGHSMGTGVAVRLVAELSVANQTPDALVLESPFNTLRDVVRGHPFSWPWRHLPHFDEMVVESLVKSGLVMDSEERIVRIKCPILILHSADDHIIPIELARRLVTTAHEGGVRVSFVEFGENRRFLHKYIHRAEELPRLVEDFLLGSQLPVRSRGRMDKAVERAEHGEHLWERREEL